MALIGQPEDAYFDCKEWPIRDDDAQRMLAKAACGLTNGEGGVLVIGMRAESKPKDEPDVVDSSVPVGDTSSVKSRVLNLIGNLVEPGIVGIDAVEIRQQEGSTSGFVVVYVPMSEGSPRRSKKDWKFYLRIGAGTFPMEYFQIEERFGKRPSPKLELYLEFETIKRDPHVPRRRIGLFVLGLSNTGSGIAKFPGIRFNRACGLSVDLFGIDGSHGFGIQQYPSESEWVVFRGGVDTVIYPGESLKITKLVQQGENPGDVPGQPQTQWLFKAFTFSCEISAEGIQTKTFEKRIPKHSQVS